MRVGVCATSIRRRLGRESAKQQTCEHRAVAECAHAIGGHLEAVKMYQDIIADDNYVDFLTLPAYEAIA